MRRARRIAKWTGLTLALLIAAAWIVSIRWGCTYVRKYPTGYSIVVLTRGCLHRGVFSRPAQVDRALLPDPEPGWHTDWVSGPIAWRPAKSDFPPWSTVTVPLWLPVIALAIPTAWLFWTDRRARPGHCRCGYDLAGLPSDAACPECGMERDSETARQRNGG